MDEHLADSGYGRPEKVEKTKEELAEIRKQMMKRRPVTAHQAIEAEEKRGPRKKQKEHPKAALMERLASGSRADVKKKDMLKLTTKNYENLPEVQKKREMEKKKEEFLKRKQQVKDLERQRRE